MFLWQDILSKFLGDSPSFGGLQRFAFFSYSGFSVSIDLRYNGTGPFYVWDPYGTRFWLLGFSQCL